MDIFLHTLYERIPDNYATVYCYVVFTVKNRSGQFAQTGSAPNFQGGMITLCTCKHLMRTFLKHDDWKGIWIAGFTGVSAGQGGNALVYLMQVGHAFASQYHLWHAPTIPERTKRAKAAHLHKFGDLFQPLGDAVDPFDWRSYKSPRHDHVYEPDDAWHWDICYENRWGRTSALLVGNPQQSHVWTQPLLYTSYHLGRGQIKRTVGKLLQNLLPGKL